MASQAKKLGSLIKDSVVSAGRGVSSVVEQAQDNVVDAGTRISYSAVQASASAVEAGKQAGKDVVKKAALVSELVTRQGDETPDELTYVAQDRNMRRQTSDRGLAAVGVNASAIGGMLAMRKASGWKGYDAHFVGWGATPFRDSDDDRFELLERADSEDSISRTQSEDLTMKQTLTKMKSEMQNITTIQDLLDDGASMEDVAEALYDVMIMQESSQFETPNFFPQVELDHCGGLEDVGKIWRYSKYGSCLFLLFVATFNVCILSVQNFPTIIACIELLWMDAVEIAHDAKRHGLLNLQKYFTHLQLMTQLEKALGEESASSIGNIKDYSKKFMFLIVASAVAFIEVTVLFSRFLSSLHALFIFLKTKTEPGYSVWSSLDLMFSNLRDAKTISALYMVNHVHPAFISAHYEHRMLSSKRSRTKVGFIAVTSCFLVERFVISLCVLSTFAVKLMLVTCKIMSPSVPWWQGVIFILGLLNQCVNLVQIQKVMVDRIFLFVFGGADARFQADERALLSVYRARLVREIWLQYWEGGNRMQAFALLSTLDHYDVQALLLEATGRSVSVPTRKDL